MANKNQVKLGGAYVEITADNAKLISGLKDSESRVQTFSSEFAKAGAAFTGIGVGITAPMKKAVDSFAAFEKQMLITQNVTKASGYQLARLTRQAKELGATTSWTTAQVAEGMLALGRMGFSNSEIEKTIKSVMDLGRALDVDVSTASKELGAVMRQFGADASQAGHYADALATATNSAAIEMGELLETMKYVGAAGSAIGADVETVLALTMALRNSGITASQAGTQLRAMFLKFQNPKDVALFADKFGVNIRNAEGRLKSFLDIIVEAQKRARTMGDSLAVVARHMFGTLQAPAFITLLKSRDLEKYRDALYNCEGAAESFREAMESGVYGALKLSESAIEAVGLQLGETLAPSVNETRQFIQDLSEIIRTFIQNNAPLVNAIAKSGVAFTSLGGVMLAGTGIIKGAVGVTNLLFGSFARINEAWRKAGADAGVLNTEVETLNAELAKLATTADAVDLSAPFVSVRNAALEAASAVDELGRTMSTDRPTSKSPFHKTNTKNLNFANVPLVVAGGTGATYELGKGGKQTTATVDAGDLATQQREFANAVHDKSVESAEDLKNMLVEAADDDAAIKAEAIADAKTVAEGKLVNREAAIKRGAYFRGQRNVRNEAAYVKNDMAPAVDNWMQAVENDSVLQLESELEKERIRAESEKKRKSVLRSARYKSAAAKGAMTKRLKKNDAELAANAPEYTEEQRRADVDAAKNLFNEQAAGAAENIKKRDEEDRKETSLWNQKFKRRGKAGRGSRLQTATTAYLEGTAEQRAALQDYLAENGLAGAGAKLDEERKAFNKRTRDALNDVYAPEEVKYIEEVIKALDEGRDISGLSTTTYNESLSSLDKMRNGRTDAEGVSPAVESWINIPADDAARLQERARQIRNERVQGLAGLEAAATKEAEAISKFETSTADMTEAFNAVLLEEFGDGVDSYQQAFVDAADNAEKAAKKADKAKERLANPPAHVKRQMDNAAQATDGLDSATQKAVSSIKEEEKILQDLEKDYYDKKNRNAGIYEISDAREAVKAQRKKIAKMASEAGGDMSKAIETATTATPEYDRLKRESEEMEKARDDANLKMIDAKAKLDHAKSPEGRSEWLRKKREETLKTAEEIAAEAHPDGTPTVAESQKIIDDATAVRDQTIADANAKREASKRRAAGRPRINKQAKEIVAENKKRQGEIEKEKNAALSKIDADEAAALKEIDNKINASHKNVKEVTDSLLQTKKEVKDSSAKRLENEQKKTSENLKKDLYSLNEDRKALDKSAEQAVKNNEAAKKATYQLAEDLANERKTLAGEALAARNEELNLLGASASVAAEAATGYTYKGGGDFSVAGGGVSAKDWVKATGVSTALPAQDFILGEVAPIDITPEQAQTRAELQRQRDRYGNDNNDLWRQFRSIRQDQRNGSSTPKDVARSQQRALLKELREMKSASAEAGVQLNTFNNILENGTKAGEEYGRTMFTYVDPLREVSVNASEAATATHSLTEAAATTTEAVSVAANALDGAADKTLEFTSDIREGTVNGQQLAVEMNNVGTAAREAGNSVAAVGKRSKASALGLLAVQFAVNAVVGSLKMLGGMAVTMAVWWGVAKVFEVIANYAHRAADDMKRAQESNKDIFEKDALLASDAFNANASDEEKISKLVEMAGSNQPLNNVEQRQLDQLYADLNGRGIVNGLVVPDPDSPSGYRVMTAGAEAAMKGNAANYQAGKLQEEQQSLNVGLYALDPTRFQKGAVANAEQVQSFIDDYSGVANALENMTGEQKNILFGVGTGFGIGSTYDTVLKRGFSAMHQYKNKGGQLYDSDMIRKTLEERANKAGLNADNAEAFTNFYLKMLGIDPETGKYDRKKAAPNDFIKQFAKTQGATFLEQYNQMKSFGATSEAITELQGKAQAFWKDAQENWLNPYTSEKDQQAAEAKRQEAAADRVATFDDMFKTLNANQQKMQEDDFTASEKQIAELDRQWQDFLAKAGVTVDEQGRMFGDLLAEEWQDVYDAGALYQGQRDFYSKKAEEERKERDEKQRKEFSQQATEKLTKLFGDYMKAVRSGDDKKIKEAAAILNNQRMEARLGGADLAEYYRDTVSEIKGLIDDTKTTLSTRSTFNAFEFLDMSQDVVVDVQRQQLEQMRKLNSNAREIYNWMTTQDEYKDYL